MDELHKFIQDQLSVWPLASSNFRSLKAAQTRTLDVGSLHCTAQHNPCRIGSTTAKVDEASIAARPCFLCPSNRPPEQFHIKFEGRKGRRYNVQVNPYPIFPSHLVIARDVHVPQSIWHNFVDMMDFARKYPDFLVFYNGPFSGASAPDHMHYQAIPSGLLPLQNAVDEFLDNPGEPPLTTGQDAKLYHFPGFCRGVYALKADTPKSLAKLFYRLVDCSPMVDGEPEPRLNMFAYVRKGEYRCFVVLRHQIRSHHYFSSGEDHLTMTPGAADIAGFFVCPREDDFHKLTPQLLSEMLDEVCITPEDERMVSWRLNRTQAMLDVPIKYGDSIDFEIISDGAGPQRVSLREGKIDYGGVLYDELYFDSVTRSTAFATASFIIPGPQPLCFAGSLKFDIDNGTIRAINHIGIENYLLSILSESIPEGTDFETVKAKAIEARTALMNDTNNCLPYKGLTIGITNPVRKAIDLTWGTTKTDTL